MRRLSIKRKTVCLTRKSIGAALACLLGVHAVGAQEPEKVEEESHLLPAAMGVRIDKSGNSWDIAADGSIGRVGSTMVNHGLALELNGQEFDSFQPLMTRDGREVVVFGKPMPHLPGVEVQRRVKLVDDLGALRYVEFFYNGSSREIVLDVFLKTNFSGNYQTFVSNRGRTEPLILEAGETGIVVSPSPGQANRAFLFNLVGSGGGLRPGISSQNRFGLTFQYRVSLESGESASLIHAVAQVAIPQNFDRQSLLALFDPYSLGGLAEKDDLDDWNELLVNLAGEIGAVKGDHLGLEALGVERDTRDVLAMGETTRLIGTAKGSEVVASGPYGEVSIPLRSVAAIVGDSGAGFEPSVYLRDGQIFSANLSLPGMSFSQTGGGKLEINASTLDRLVLGNAEADIDWRESGVAMIETYSGDRLRINDPEALKFIAITAWGELPIALNQLTWLEPIGRSGAGYMLELMDGTRCRVFLGRNKVSVDTDLLGNISISPVDLRRVTTLAERGQPKQIVQSGMRAAIRAAGGQVIVGNIGNTTLPLVSSGVLIDTPTSQIRQITRVEGTALSSGGMPEKSPHFEIERWDGGVLSGLIRLDELSMRVGGRNWKIPLEDIQEIDMPWPLPDHKSLEAIKKLITLLGSSEWDVREKATRELGAFGYLARPVLQRELATSGDPEVSRRLERILTNVN